MKTAKQRFDNQRFTTFKANLDGKLFLNGKFRGRMILENLVSNVEEMAPGESWSLGRIHDGNWVVLHQEGKHHHAEWIISPGQSLRSMEGTIPLPDDLRAQFDREIGRKPIASLLETVRLNVSPGAGKTSAIRFYIDSALLIADRAKREPGTWRLDQFMGPHVSVWRP